MKKSVFTITILLFGLSLLLKSQSFRPGYIIQNNDDTIHGFIKYTGGNKFTEACVFKSDQNGEPVSYYPGEIYGYRIEEGKFFISKNVDSTYKFLEYLIQGEANVYFYGDKVGSHYFIETTEAGLVELSEPERMVLIGNRTYLAPTKYKGKLVSVLSDYDDILQKTENVKLNHESLINLALDYHEFVCDSIDCIVFETKLKPMKFEWGLLAGVNLKKLSFGLKVDSKYGPGFQVGGF